MAPSCIPPDSIAALARAKYDSSDRVVDARAIVDEGCPNLKPPELAGPVTLPLQSRQIRRPPALSLVARSPILQNDLDKVPPQPDSPSTPHWGTEPASTCRSHRWCNTPVTDVEDDKGDLVSDDNSSVMSFDGGSAIGSPPLNHVDDTVLRTRKETPESTCETGCDENAEIEKEVISLVETAAAESARTLTAAPEKATKSLEDEQDSSDALQRPTRMVQFGARMESIRAALKRAASLSSDGTKVHDETCEEHSIELENDSTLIPLGADELMHCKEGEPCHEKDESLSTETPSICDSVSDQTNSPASSHFSTDDSVVPELPTAVSDQSSCGPVGREAAQSCLGAAGSDDLPSWIGPSAPIATPNSHSSGKSGQSLQPPEKLLEGRSCSMPLLATQCTKPPLRAHAGRAFSKVENQPAMRMPKTSTVPEVSSSAAGEQLQSIVNSVRPSVQDVGGVCSRSISPITSEGSNRTQTLTTADTNSSSSCRPVRIGRNGSLLCPKGHKLLPTGIRTDWICDGCENRFAQLPVGDCCHRCALCDFDLCGSCARSAMLMSVDVQVPRQNTSEVHRAALLLMRRTEDLGRAYKYLEEVNQLNIRYTGVVLPAAVYNQACCLTLGAQAMLDGAGALIQPQLPPCSADTAPVRIILEHRLNLAVEMLEKAVKAGYSDATNMLTDPDLTLVRERRPQTFASVMQLLHHVA